MVVTGANVVEVTGNVVVVSSSNFWVTSSCCNVAKSVAIVVSELISRLCLSVVNAIFDDVSCSDAG